MVSQRKKKFESGEGSQYWSRATAMKKLQLSLKDFRRLCILKGIYPREPRNRKRAQKGATGIKTLYHKKDIQFLMHEPIIWKIRDMKTHGRKIGRAKAMGEFAVAKRLMKNPPTMTLDHIVKERYPTFLDALKDLDDCLTLCFLFSTFPSLRHIPRDQSALCRRLTMEFLHAVIMGKSLKKVFISIKGYYFQAEIKGILITWIVPHHFSFEPQSKEEVDFRIMSTFVQFYIVLLGFVNFRLYHTLNLHYPPKFGTKIDKENTDLVDKDSFVSERIAALNAPICGLKSDSAQEDEIQLDRFNLENADGDIDKTRMEAEKEEKLKTLFKGLKVFLGRECPREPLTFILRCFGAEVSWDRTLFLGATFNEDDESITHQITDRPKIEKQFLSRYYVQPQWVFDSVNARELLPVEKYFIGCILPPHLSPFVDSTRTQYYVPPEARGEDSNLGLYERMKAKDLTNGGNDETGKDDEEGDHSETEVDEEEEVAQSEEEEDMDSDHEEEHRRKEMTKNMKVVPGKPAVIDPDEKRKEERQEFKLREKMIEKKHRALYKSMMKGRAQRMQDVRALRRKRRIIDQNKVALETS